MSLDAWNENPDGTVEVYPLVAYETLVAHAVMCGLRIHYLESRAQMMSGKAASVPLILTPEMARALAGALLKSADEADKGPRDETPH